MEPSWTKSSRCLNYGRVKFQNLGPFILWCTDTMTLSVAQVMSRAEGCALPLLLDCTTIYFWKVVGWWQLIKLKLAEAAYSLGELLRPAYLKGGHGPFLSSPIPRNIFQLPHYFSMLGGTDHIDLDLQLPLLSVNGPAWLLSESEASLIGRRLSLNTNF